MARTTYRMNPARLRFGVFLLLAVAVIATQSQADSQPRAAAAEQSGAAVSGPLFRYVVGAARGLASVSSAAGRGQSGS